MEHLSLVLWRERELLEALAYRLDQERMLLAADRTRWLARCAAEVDAALAAVRAAEVLRAVEADRAAASAGLPPGSTLRAIAAAAAEPFASLLLEHRAALTSLSTEVDALAQETRVLLTVHHRSVRKAVLSLASRTLAPVV